MICVERPADLRAHLGEEALSTKTVEIDGALIDAFIAVSGDDAPLHRGPDAIAPGNLLLALAPRLIKSAIEVRLVESVMTARVDRVAFRSPVRVGACLSLRAKVARVASLPGRRTVVAVDCVFCAPADIGAMRVMDVYHCLD